MIDVQSRGMQGSALQVSARNAPAASWILFGKGFFIVENPFNASEFEI